LRKIINSISDQADGNLEEISEISSSGNFEADNFPVPPSSVGDSSHTYVATKNPSKYDAFSLGSHAEKGYMAQKM
jgi:hypothetical protein